MKWIYACMLSAFFVIISFTADSANSKKIDSLKAIIDATAPDANKVDFLLELATHYYGANPDEAIRIGNEAVKLGEELKYHKGVAYGYKTIGIAHYVKGDNTRALQNWQLSLDRFKSIEFQEGIANILSNMGAIHYNEQHFEIALEHYFEALEVSQIIGDKLRSATAYLNIGAVYQDQRLYDKASKYYQLSLELSEELKDKEAIGTCLTNLGEVYFKKGDYDIALEYFEKSLKPMEDTKGLAYSKHYIGKVYAEKGDFENAIKYETEAYEIAKKLDSKLDMTTCLNGLGHIYLKKGNIDLSISKFLEAEKLAREVDSDLELQYTYQGLSEAYHKIGDHEQAFHYVMLFSGLSDSLYTSEIQKKMKDSEIQMNEMELAKKEAEAQVQEERMRQQKIIKNAFMGGLGLVLLILFILTRNFLNKIKINKILDKQKEEIEKLLLNILPAKVADELKQKGQATPRHFESVTVLFADFKGFTTISKGMSPGDLVTELNNFFIAFDAIMDKYNLEKIKTIGDCYMCAGGIPTENDTHPLDMVHAAIEMQEYMTLISEKKKELGLESWNLRIGIHTGPVVAGVVGRRKYAYDIWGSTVNVASRLESNGEAGKINISEFTYNLIKDHYKCIPRGKIFAKNYGDIEMYFVDEPVQQFSKDVKEAVA
ncbi:MAG: tetratricopeptide repeat protein [Chitinophagales bacterium]|nr:tetratricopeptide repeat protein [Chitinophagales bacterium]